MIGSLPIDDWAVVLRMAAVLALASWAALPLAARLIPGAGWIVAASLAWVILGWVPWVLAALYLVPFDSGAFAGLIVLLALRMALTQRGGARRMPWQGTIIALGFFAVLFWLGLAQRMSHPELRGLEKFTDLGFLAAALRSAFMPPESQWYAGEALNYYYVGQAMAAAWGHVAGARADQAYQMAMATLFALSGLSVWWITQHLTRAVAGRRGAQALGGVAAVLTLYGGNFHSVLYTWARGWMGATNESFYFPDSTRFIGFDPPTDDKGFTEFLAYGFAVGDLHAHVVATPVFLLGVMLVLAVVRRGLRGRAPDWVQAAGFGWLIGLGAQTNSWDVAVLGMMALFAGVVLALRAPQSLAFRLDQLGCAAVIVLAAAFVTAAPFLGQFTPFASGIIAAPARTPLWQLAVVYGHALLPLALFALLVWRMPALRRDMRLAVLWVSILSLIIVPEVMIVRDIYGLDYARANTMFKLSFRAQTLIIIAGVAVLPWAWAMGRYGRAASVVAALPLLAILAYVPHIFTSPARIQSLDGLGFLGAERALVARAATLPIGPDRRLVEASGPSFETTARVSAVTGQPVVIGWAAHEWLWRNDADGPNRRAQQIRVFYTTADQGQRCAIQRRYRIGYVILGQIEAEFYPDLNAQGIRDLGVVIHDDAGGQIVQIDPARCR